MAEIILTPVESEEYFYNALCNGLGYVQCHGITMGEEKHDDYVVAKAELQEAAPNTSFSYEDVYMQILRMGNRLMCEDEEGGEDTVYITLQDVHERVSKTPFEHLVNMISEQDDADTADVILQTVFLGEIIYG